MRSIWLVIVAALFVSACGDPAELRATAEKKWVYAGEQVPLMVTLVGQYPGTYIDFTMWQILTPECGDLYTIGGDVWGNDASNIWIAPYLVSVPRLCEIQVTAVIKDVNHQYYSEEKSYVFPETVIPLPQNMPPGVTLVYPALECVTPNKPVNLSVRYMDSSGGYYTFHWWYTGGRFDGGTSGSGVAWIPPTEPGEYAVGVSVTDAFGATGGDSVTYTVCQ